MTVAIPAVTFPGAGTGRDMTGHRPASGLLVIMARPVAPPPGPGSQPVPPRWSRDRSGLWLRNAAAGLCVLAAAAAAVSFTAQYRMVDATRHLPVVAALEAAIPDAAALVFACLGIALALHGRRALRARALNLASVAASVFMNAIAAAPGWRNLAIWAMPPVAYALASDTLITVVRTRHQQLTADAATPLAILGGLILWLLRLALAPVSTLAGFRAWVLEECPVAPGRRAARPAPPPAAARPGQGGGTVPRKATKTARFLVPGHRTARASRLHPAGSRRLDQRRPGLLGQPSRRCSPRRPPQSRPRRPQRRPLMMLKYVIALAVLIVLAAAFAWAFLPARNLPGNRARHLRIRLHLRLHPGKGFAHVFSLWLRWSRFAVLRRSGQIRPALPWRYSLLDPGEHSVLLGRAHYRHQPARPAGGAPAGHGPAAHL